VAVIGCWFFKGDEYYKAGLATMVMEFKSHFGDKQAIFYMVSIFKK
jgi:hypothetical protein